jgi:hypothetical protein
MSRATRGPLNASLGLSGSALAAGGVPARRATASLTERASFSVKSLGSAAGVAGAVWRRGAVNAGSGVSSPAAASPFEPAGKSSRSCVKISESPAHRKTASICALFCVILIDLFRSPLSASRWRAARPSATTTPAGVTSSHTSASTPSSEPSISHVSTSRRNAGRSMRSPQIFSAPGLQSVDLPLHVAHRGLEESAAFGHAARWVPDPTRR